MEKCKSMVLEKPFTMRMKEFDIPDVAAEDMLLKVDMVGICGGDPIEYEGRNKKVHYPLILGHEMVGRIAKIGSEAQKQGFAVGDRVTVEPYIVCGKCEYCLNGLYQFCETSRAYGVNISCNRPPHLFGAYGEYMYVERGSKVHRIAPEVPDEAACMSSVLGNGVRWVRTLGQVKFRETVLVLGLGAQGLVSVIAAKEAGAGPIIVAGKTRNNTKWELAKEFGADYLIDIDKTDALEAIADITGGKMAEVVIETTGANAMMELGISAAKIAGRLVMAGTCGYAQNSLTTDLIVFKELKVLGGLGQSWDTEIAVDIINSRKYPIEKMISQVFPLERADEAMKFYMTEKSKTIRVAIKP